MSTSSLPTLDPDVSEKMNGIYDRRSKLYPSDYAGLLAPFRDTGYNIVRLQDIFNSDELHGQKVLGLRHDVDHDYVTALRIAEWEHKEGLHSTYCVLHTAWYYGEPNEKGRYNHTREFVDFCHSLQEMGHEVNIHNNFVAMALRTGLNAEDIFTAELNALRGYGLDIFGTSGHGDALCGQLDFINLEMFEGNAWDSRGGVRTLVGPEGSVALGTINGKAMGLTYEAYDYPRDIYCSDSGGRPRVIRNTRGLRGYRRSELAEQGIETPFPSYCGVLTHPMWWDFKTPNVQVKIPLFERAYRHAGLSKESLQSDKPHDPTPVLRDKWPTVGGEFEPLKIGRNPGLFHDEICYRAPVNINKNRARTMIAKDEYKAFVQTVTDYVMNNTDAGREALHRQIAVLKPDLDLVANSLKLNAKSLANDERYFDLGVLLFASVVAAQHSSSGELANDTAKYLSQLRKPDMVSICSKPYIASIFGTTSAALLGLTYLDKEAKYYAAFTENHAAFEAAIDNQLSVWHFNHGKLTVKKKPIPIKLSSLIGLFLIYRKKARLSKKNDSVNLANSATHLRNHCNRSGTFSEGWTDENGKPAPTVDLWVTIWFALAAFEHQVEFSEQELEQMGQAIRSKVLREENWPALDMSEKSPDISSVVESECGLPPVLALWPIGAFDNAMLIELCKQLTRPEFSFWLRHPLSVLANGARFYLPCPHPEPEVVPDSSEVEESNQKVAS